MDLLLFWLSVIGTLLVGSFFFHALNTRNMKAAAWYGAIGVVCLVLLFVLQLGKEIFTTAPIDARQVDRPIVAVDRIGVESLLNSEGNSVKLAVRAIIKNSGRTPALKMRGAVNLTGRASVIPDDFDYPDVDSGQLATVMLLAPNQEMRSGDFLIDVAYADRVRAGVSHMFLYGWIEYDDSFEGGGRHRTEFCYKIEVAGNPRLKRNPLLVSQHGPYNCIDKSCRYATGREPPKSRERQFPPNISPD